MAPWSGMGCLRGLYRCHGVPSVYHLGPKGYLGCVALVVSWECLGVPWGCLCSGIGHLGMPFSGGDIGLV